MKARKRDTLTGLANRDGFGEAVRALIDAHPRERFVLLYGDIDRFKVFNDRYGTEAGDRLLASIGAAIASLLPDRSVAGRLRADHFVACIPRAYCDPERVLKQLDAWLRSYPSDFAFFVRLGVYEIDDPSLDVSLMTDRALLALRAAKTGAHASKFVRFDESLRDSVVKEQELAGEMADALASGQFELYFQPQYRFTTGELVGAEVLARWNHPKKGLISPAEFIPVFERNGLISELDYYVWAEASRCLRTWLDEAGPEGEAEVPRLSVNLSRTDVYRDDLCDYLTGLMQKNRLPFDLFHLEITESAYTEAPEQLTASVERLQQAGFTVEMDDFGSGYSSLNVLKDVPVDVLKLDLRFLDARNDTRGGLILASVVRMARWLDLPVIAEGVESKSQALYLSSIGCDIMQGFWFSRPVDRASFEQMLRETKLGRLGDDGRVRGPSREMEDEVSQLWDADSIIALVFNSYVGPAALAEYDGVNFEVVRANDEFHRLLGLPLDRFARTARETFGDLDDEGFENLKHALEQTGEQGRGECELCVRGRGEDFWVRVTARQLMHRGAVSSMLLLLEEITETKVLRDHLRAALKSVMKDKERELQFKVQAEQQQQLFDAVPCGIVRYTAEEEPRIVSANREACRILHCDTVEEFFKITRCNPFSPLEDEGQKLLLDIHSRLRAGSEPIPFEARIVRADGTDGWVEGVSALTTTLDGQAIVQSAFNDVTEQRRELHERAWQTERYRILSELTHAISFDYDSEFDTVLLYIDRDGTGMEPQVISHYLEKLKDGRGGVVHPDSVQAVRAMFERVREGTTNEIIEYRADYYGTGYQWYRTNLFVAHDQGGSWHLVGLIENIQTERELRLKAEVDAVTGLSNYAAAHDLINNALADPHMRAHSACAVIDLDDFKAVNDTFGHLKGDELLRRVGEALRSNCRESDVVGRVGGDEFVLLLKNIGFEVALRKFAAMKRAVAALFDSDAADAGLHPTISIGVTATRPDDTCYQDVFARADGALYEAKGAGKNRLRVFREGKGLPRS